MKKHSLNSKICLLGLSGAGKSYLAERISRELGFRYIGIDKEIRSKLGIHLGIDLSNLTEMANWMGQPYSEGYAEREALYLEFEEETTQKAIDEIKSTDSKIVLDSTGSFIYLSEKTISKAKELFRFVYLSIPQSERQALFEQYIQDPKPVVWGTLFKQNKDQSEEDSLKTCYSQLLEWRCQRYSSLADSTLVMNRENRNSYSATELLRLSGIDPGPFRNK